jgi:hypothetical protein
MTTKKFIICCGYPSISRINGYAILAGGPIITITDGIRWIISPGKGDLPVGQFDAQNRFPKGRGTPSFASSGWLKNEGNGSNNDIRSGP